MRGRPAASGVSMPGFDYARALGVSTWAELRRQWRRRCDAAFPDDRGAADACYRLILPSTYSYLSERAPAA